MSQQSDWDTLAEGMADRAAIATIIAADAHLIEHITREHDGARAQQTACESDGTFKCAIVARSWGYYAEHLATVLLTVINHKLATEALLSAMKG